MTVIGALAYQIVMDQSKFAAGSSATKKETAEIKRLFRETRTPAELYQAAVQRLGDLHKRGAIDATMYARGLAAIKAEHAGVTQQQKLTEALQGTAVGLKLGALAANPYTVAIAAVGLATGKAVSTITSGVSAIKEMALAGIAAVDAQSEMSAKLGVSVGDLAAFNRMADLNGSSADVMQNALQLMSARLVTAGEKGSDAGKALRSIGLSVADLQAKTPAEAYRAIATAIAQVESPAKRTALAMDIFGKAGKQIAGVLGLGGAAFEESRRAVERYGLALSDAKANQIGEANDKVDDLRLAWSGVATQLGSAVAPAVAQIAGDLTDLLSNPFFKGEMNSLFTAMAGGVSALSQSIKGMGIGLMTLDVWARNSTLVKLWSKFTPVGIAAKSATGFLSDKGKSIQSRVSPNRPQSAVGEIDDSAKASAATDSHKKLNRILDEADKARHSAATKQEIYNTKLGDLNRLLAVGAINAKTWARGIKAAHDEMNKDDIEKAKKAAEETKRTEEKKQKEIAQMGRRARDDAKTDQQRAAEEVLRLQLLSGAGELNSMDAEKLMRQQAEKLAGPVTGSGFQLAARGSVAEYQSIQRAQNEENHERRINVFLDRLKAQAAEISEKMGIYDIREQILALTGSEVG